MMMMMTYSSSGGTIQTSGTSVSASSLSMSSSATATSASAADLMMNASTTTKIGPIHTGSASGTAITAGSGSTVAADQSPLSIDELCQLMRIVQSIPLSSLDPHLSNFTSMNFNWYLKLLKAFQDLRQSPINRHKIYQVKGSTLGGSTTNNSSSSKNHKMTPPHIRNLNLNPNQQHRQQHLQQQQHQHPSPS